MKNNYTRRHVITDDGSSSFFSERFQDSYHSRHGAIQEARHVFLQNGLRAIDVERENIAIFEMGFGTGLNVLLTCLEDLPCSVSMTTLEADPLTKEEVGTVNYATQILHSLSEDVFKRMHAVAWGQWHELRPGFSLRKISTDLVAWTPDQDFDLFYFDAFAPDVQPELWVEDVFQSLFACANPGAVLVTYSAKGAVRRALQAAGWSVERLPGPPGKREMLRGRKKKVSVPFLNSERNA